MQIPVKIDRPVTCIAFVGYKTTPQSPWPFGPLKVCPIQLVSIQSPVGPLKINTHVAGPRASPPARTSTGVQDLLPTN